MKNILKKYIQRGLLLFVLQVSTVALAQTKVVVVPLGDSAGVYAQIEGVWFGSVATENDSYTVLWTNKSDADVGSVAASVAYIGNNGDEFRCSGVQTRVTETDNIYDFTETILSNEGCVASGATSLTYNPDNDTLMYTYDPKGQPESGILNRVTQVAPF